ncbi:MULTISPECIES: branched-chain-amino-acid transaminase [Heyndrickxia]|uniref:branched-chain-amino-acid transaminase n=1 Tax=Heyndrickxia TaxID=2837504 RepID=UPI0024333604|nr:branched-chain-amino-acid transaminase [Heyndrickxia oleronia]MCI1591901.1 branched-chain-amino-acid transaminase [Heyndrickxia oleronia]MCI1614558.1 branched-chain-amino-acid transaminase [Heyndrickxia oleronia]MCI1743391.1 branched-chain-amino-acid transaminase [Heyndrickxia oleronia]MCI1762334.1 branched-chain-amino-acid transaminase [Heyndrickxia oleronia]
MADQWIFLNDRFVKKEEAVVSVYDHGFLYGDGVFEGIRMYSGNVFRLDDHIKRLYESAHSITLKIPYDQEELKQLIIETLRKNEFQDAYIRVVISRGVGDLGLSPFTCKHPGVIIIAEPLALFPKELYESGIEVVSVASRRNRSDVLDPKVKSLNYLNNILVKIEASLAGASEALMMNDQGYVAEGSGDNIFIVKDNVIKTPPGYVGTLEGITRNVIIELAKQLGFEIREDVFTRHDVYIADEVFLTGTAAEVIAVVKVDGRNIADGQPGPVTNKLLEAFRNVVTVDGTKVYETDQIQVS